MRKGKGNPLVPLVAAAVASRVDAAASVCSSALNSGDADVAPLLGTNYPANYPLTHLHMGPTPLNNRGLILV